MDIELREIREEDLELIRSWRNSKEVSSYMYTEKEISFEDQERWFKKIKEDKTKRYWIISYGDKKLGVASLDQISEVFNSCYWAFYLGDSSVRGAGIGAKVEYNVLRYVFEELRLNKLRCEVFVTNDKVIKMHEKFGFRREAYYREHCLKGNSYLDVVGLAMLKKEWVQIKDKMYEKIYGRN